MSSGAGCWLVAAALSQVEGRLATRVRAHGTDPEQGRGCLLSGPCALTLPPLPTHLSHGGAVWAYELLRVRLLGRLVYGKSSRMFCICTPVVTNIINIAQEGMRKCTNK